MTEFLERLATWLQGLLPQRLASALVYRLMRSEVRWLKNLLIRTIGAVAGVDWSEAASADPDDYRCFNAFFTRALRAGVRHIDRDPAAVACPCDGAVSALGTLDGNRLLQAKGVSYALQDLLADDPACDALRNGSFFTLYLSPRDYHRVHMPVDGQLLRMGHVPGRLFSVAPYTVRQRPGLFARNERVVSLFEGAFGPFALVLVGAMLVSSVTTVWAGEVTPARVSAPAWRDYAGAGVRLAKGEEMGRFNMGSTVILLLPPNALAAPEALQPDQRVRLGERLATLGGPA